MSLLCSPLSSALLAPLLSPLFPSLAHAPCSISITLPTLSAAHSLDLAYFSHTLRCAPPAAPAGPSLSSRASFPLLTQLLLHPLRARFISPSHARRPHVSKLRLPWDSHSPQPRTQGLGTRGSSSSTRLDRPAIRSRQRRLTQRHGIGRRDAGAAGGVAAAADPLRCAGTR